MKSKESVLIGFIICMFASCVVCKVYLSMSQLKESVDVVRDGSLKKNLYAYIREQQETLKDLKRYVDNWSNVSVDELHDPEFKVHHPLNAYRFIRNFSGVHHDSVGEIVKLIDKFQNAKPRLDTLEKLKTKYPQHGDLVKAIKTILQLQHTYGIPTGSVCEGIIWVELSKELSALECFEIGLVALAQRKYYLAREWIDRAIYLTDIEESKVIRETILHVAASSASTVGAHGYAISLADQLIDSDPTNEHFQILKKTCEDRLESFRKTASQKEKTAMWNIGVHKDEITVVDALCRGLDPIEKNFGAAKPERLSCRYVDNRHHLLLLQPSKLEVVSKDPYIAVYHNAVQTSEMEDIRTIAKEQLMQSRIGNGRQSSQQRNPGLYLNSMAYPRLQRLYRRLGATRSLAPESFSNLKVTNYGLDGFHYSRQDFDKVSHKATFMFYLSDVDAGGAIVFPEVMKSIHPEAGKVIFWHNLNKNGKGNYKTSNAACPVMLGEKWAGTVSVGKTRY